MASGDEAATSKKSEANSEAWLPFDFQTLRPKSWFARFTTRLTETALPAGMWLARTFYPVPRLAGFYWITRRADVEAALADPVTFAVPYGPEMRALSRGADGREGDFVLGLDGPGQQRQNAIIREILISDDIRNLKSMATAFSASLIAGSRGRIDVVGDFSVRVPTEICGRYFGLDVADPVQFADWSIAVSACLFADPGNDPVKDRLGRAGAQRLCHVIDRAIVRVRRAPAITDFAQMNLVERLIHLSMTRPELALDEVEVRAILLGLITGFIPTNGLAAAKMIEEILQDSKLRKQAHHAAANGDESAMVAVVREAGRLNPALAPGQWRRTTRSTNIGGRSIPAGATVMVSTMSAMRDSGGVGDPSELMFGHGVHRCLGQQLALSIIAQMFLVLFRQPRLQRSPGPAGRMQRIGYFPRRLEMQFESESATQTMVLLSIPIEIGRAQADHALDMLGNPASGPVRAELDATERVHFASAVVIGLGDDGGKPDRLVLELNVDGPPDTAIQILGNLNWLSALVRSVRPADTRPVPQILTNYRVRLHVWPWGPTGLNFFGTGDFAVREIARQSNLRRRAEAAIASAKIATATAPSMMARLETVRRHLRSDPDLDSYMVQPRGKRLAIATWRPPAHFWAPISNVLGDKVAATVFALVGLSALGFGLLFNLTLDLEDASFFERVGQLLLVVMLAIIATLFVWGIVAAGSWLLFRRAESREMPDDRPPSIDSLREILKRENAPGYRQNHITAVTLLKRGLIRRLTFAFSMWGIRQSLNWFRPGYVVTMGTIHYAKWFRLPGSRKLVFQSNYDGSWQSYLEDFITRAHPGQTAAWSNGEGFPKSKNFIGEGAKDGDRFKRWVRRQQVPTRFWYSRFPELTTADIRTNALIHHGLAFATTDTDARAWFDLFGSAPRQSYELEKDEIQSILLRGLARASYTACLLVRLPEQASKRRAWLEAVAAEVSFGEVPDTENAMFIGVSATGLQQIGRVGSSASRDELDEVFPAPFVMGMAARGAILGDGDPHCTREPWRWRDTGAEAATDPSASTEKAGVPTVDVALLLYAADRNRLSETIAIQIGRVREMGGEIVHEPILTTPVARDGTVANGTNLHFAYEHFGFRDGLTSPVIRGNERPGSATDDAVQPGEFIMGYRNEQGYFAASVLVSPESDTSRTLSVAAEQIADGRTDFVGPDAQATARDLGRNGSFMVIRQLVQDRDGFREFTQQKARQFNEHYGNDTLREAVETSVDGDWFAAKMMGRWQNGQPLIGHPRQSDAPPEPYPDDNFQFGRDDPRGHACPLGAHIRRANARDSLNPTDPLERAVSRRHLLLRRGRTYFRNPDGRYVNDAPLPDAERGLLFVALCADLERQFEFVQQSWLGFPGFHGLSNEPDPIATRAGVTGERNFTIPTPRGPLVARDMRSFVQVSGGGYFFIPSRSALHYLASDPEADPADADDAIK